MHPTFHNSLNSRLVYILGKYTNIIKQNIIYEKEWNIDRIIEYNTR